MRFALLLCFSGLLPGQGTATKLKVEEYEEHTQARSAALGAEFMVHSFSSGEASYLAQDYLVVEVALFPSRGETINIRNSDFSLRINGKKQTLQPQPPTMVAAGLQHPEWRQPDGLRPEVGGQAGNVGGSIGGPPRNNNPFPGSVPPGQQAPQRVPIPDANPTGVPKIQIRADELLIQTALVEGPRHSPGSGFIYFPYKGKISSIKSLELLYEDAVIKLR